MISQSAPPIDSSDAETIVARFDNMRQGYVPQWAPRPKSAGEALGQVFSRFGLAILQRLNQVPARNKLAFLDLLGLRLVPAQSARAPIVFALSSGAPDSAAPAGTKVAAAPPPGVTQQIVFETVADAGIAAAKLTQVVSLWPGRDQYIDHSTAIIAGQPATLFQRLALQPTDHILYLAHSTLLAVSGTAHLKVAFELALGSPLPLDMAWEYWDGQVWRSFIPNQASCLDPIEPGHDGTNGLSVSGTVHLDAEGAKAVQTTVNNVQSYWIRGRLTQTLPVDPAVILPNVESIRLASAVDRGMELKLAANLDTVDQGMELKLAAPTVIVLDECGQPLTNVDVILSLPDDPGTYFTPLHIGTTEWVLQPVDWTFVGGTTYQFTVAMKGIRGSVLTTYRGVIATPLIIITAKVEGLLPDKAYCETKTLDITKAFYPLGQNPDLGTSFYFKQNEALAKPGARVQLYFDPVSLSPSSGKPIHHTLNWEYWDGNEWTLIVQSSTKPSGDFTLNEIIEFTVPPDMVTTRVNNEDGFWIRVRLVAGGYGIVQTINIPNGNPPSVTYVQPRPPAVAVFRLGYSWTKGPAPFEQVFTYNDFHFEDHTAGAKWPGTLFTPYRPISETAPALYLGFSKALPINNFGMYFDIVERVAANPAMVWEYWNGGDWLDVPVTDETDNLRLPGMITFIPAADSQALARFASPLYWLRGRLKEDGAPSETTINAIYPNAVWASQRQTFANSPIGASTGAPNQIFTFTQIPVLLGQRIEVEELSGPRANTEWRLIALDISSGDADIIATLERMLAAEGSQTSIVLDELRLTRDKNKLVTEVWVAWQEQQNFFDSRATDRHYLLDHASGRLFFGDGNAGMIPPAGAAIQAVLFRSGGGLAGNVAAATITQLQSSVEGIQGVTNPRAAEGGADGETLEEFASRAPMSIRDRGRAIVPPDYETMAFEASAAVAVARAIPTFGPSGQAVPGWVTVMIIPHSQDPRPVPSSGLRQDVLVYILQRCPANVAGAPSVQVVGPTYLPIDVTATLAPKDPTEADTVEQAALTALTEFLNPLYGGPGGIGWDLGRDVFASDIAAVLGAVEGVDYVEELALSVNGALQGNQVPVPFGQIAVAGQLKLSLVLPVDG